MHRQNIFKTLSVGSVVPSSMRQDLLDFLIDNKQYIYTTQKRHDAFRSRYSAKTSISEIVNRINILGKDMTYSLIRVPPKTADLREVVDMTFIPFDLLQIKDVTPTASLKTLSVISELNDKIVINISDIAKDNGEFSDVTQFHNRVVRDFLSRSFYNSSGNIWISPALVRYVAKVYSMTIGRQIAGLFGLSSPIQMFVQTLFCMYFVSQMTSVDSTQPFIKTNSRNLGINDTNDLIQIFAFVEDTIGKKSPETIEDVLLLISKYGHSQLSNNGVARLTRPVLNMRFATMSSESHMSTIALEYPPYFLFLILQVLSNVKVGLSFHMKTLNLIKEGHEVIDQTLKSSSFTAGL